MDRSTKSLIRAKVGRRKRGELLFPDDFSDTGTSEAIRLALYRLEKEGFVRRVAHGIYVRPRISKYAGEIMPTAEEVAKGIAKRDRITLVPTGVQALHALGLSTQVPMKLVYLTDGAPRTIKVGKRTIKLKRVTPKNLQARGTISSLVIQALKEIGKNDLTLSEKNKILDILRQENRSFLHHDLRLAPAWIREIMKKAL